MREFDANYGQSRIGRPDKNHCTFTLSVTDVPVEHSVKIQDFDAWLCQEGGTPRERADRSRIREILGLSASRAT
jgi:hypothetical protein